MRDVQRAAHELEKAAKMSTDTFPATKSRTAHAFADPTTFKLDNLLWEDSKGMFAIPGQATMVIF